MRLSLAVAVEISGLSTSWSCCSSSLAVAVETPGSSLIGSSVSVSLRCLPTSFLTTLLFSAVRLSFSVHSSSLFFSDFPIYNFVPGLSFYYYSHLSSLLRTIVNFNTLTLHHEIISPPILSRQNITIGLDIYLTSTAFAITRF